MRRRRSVVFRHVPKTVVPTKADQSRTSAEARWLLGLADTLTWSWWLLAKRPDRGMFFFDRAFLKKGTTVAGHIFLLDSWWWRKLIYTAFREDETTNLMPKAISQVQLGRAVNTLGQNSLRCSMLALPIKFSQNGYHTRAAAIMLSGKDWSQARPITNEFVDSRNTLWQISLKCFGWEILI